MPDIFIQNPFRSDHELRLETLSVEELTGWLSSAWASITDADAIDALLRSRDAGDDVPHLSMVERTQGVAYERAYGPWGCERQVSWEWHGGRAGVEGMCRMTAEFLGGFVERNGRICVSLRGPCFTHAAEVRVRAFAEVTDLAPWPSAWTNWRRELARQARVRATSGLEVRS